MKVMIVDDHAGVRNIIRQLLAAPGDSFVECATGEASVRAAHDFEPDYVTMDIRLPDLSGLEATRAIRAIHPRSRIIIVTSYDQPFLRQSASESGAVAYVLKDNLAELRALIVDGATPPLPSGSASPPAPESTRRNDLTNTGAPGKPATAPTESPIEAGRKPDNPKPSAAERPLRILMVEDNRNDCELILRQVRRCGFAAQATRVDTGPELRRALEQRSWDLIITDHQLPTFSGAEVLALIREIGLNIPTLCVTGSVDPAKIKEVLDAGACAFISKDDLAPLCAAVRSALNRGALQSNPPGRSASGDGTRQ